MFKSTDNITEGELLEEDLIESRIGVHDSNHFEVKLDYSIAEQGRSRYNVDYYLFVPASLGVNKHTYRDENFFSDVQAYIRFKTPNQTLNSVSNDSALIRGIHDLIAKLRKPSRNKNDLDKLTYELRMFGCIVRANIRDRVLVLRKKLRRASKGNNPVLLSDIDKICICLVSEIRQCMEVWRELRADFVDGRLPQAANETFAYVDEYLSLVVEMKLASVLRRVDMKLGNKLQRARKQVRDLLLVERHYRSNSGYSRVTGGDEDDHFVYRLGLLKKFVMSVLWLDINRVREGKRVANLGAAIAAGFAMFFALLATIYAGDYYGINSWNFIAAGVGTYILKDRIKDWLKSFFGSKFSRFLADFSIGIRDPISDIRIGRCRESFSFAETEDVPASVLQVRYKDAKASIEAMAKPEVVMHYEKQVYLKGQRIIERMHLADYNLNDIVRFSLSQFQTRADDPTSSIPYYSEETDTVDRRDFRKVYHLNLVMVLRNKGNQREILKRVRVIFDKRAILELQEVE